MNQNGAKYITSQPCQECVCCLPSCFSRVRLCATPETAAHQAPPSLGCSRQEHWSGLPFPSPVHESEKWKWSCWVVSNSQWLHGLQPTRLLHPWDFPGKSTGVGCHCLRLCIPLLLYPLIYWWTLRLLQYLVYVNNVAMNIDIHISFRISVFIFFG